MRLTKHLGCVNDMSVAQHEGLHCTRGNQLLINKRIEQHESRTCHIFPGLRAMRTARPYPSGQTGRATRLRAGVDSDNADAWWSGLAGTSLSVNTRDHTCMYLAELQDTRCNTCVVDRIKDHKLEDQL